MVYEPERETLHGDYKPSVKAHYEPLGDDLYEVSYVYFEEDHRHEGSYLTRVEKMTDIHKDLRDYFDFCFVSVYVEKESTYDDSLKTPKEASHELRELKNA